MGIRPPYRVFLVLLDEEDGHQWQWEVLATSKQRAYNKLLQGNENFQRATGMLRIYDLAEEVKLMYGALAKIFASA